jgi:diguanylate cyclase (GGDEF)-like protein
VISLRRFTHDRPTIGVLAGWSSLAGTRPYQYRALVVGGMQSAAKSRNCHLLLSWGIRPMNQVNQTYIAWPQVFPGSDFVPVGPWNTDGLIIFRPLMNASQALYLEELAAKGFPILFVGAGQNGVDISVNNQMGIQQAVSHLVEHGHQRIAFLAGLPTDTGDSKSRLEGYYSAMAQHDLEVDPDLITWGWHDFTEGYKATQASLQRGERFTALITSNDNSAFGAMQAIQEAGLRIPQDIAIIGFDNEVGAIAQTPPLTSVHVALKMIGEQALLMMANHLTEQSPLESIHLSTRLIRRQSCGCSPEIVSSVSMENYTDGHRIVAPTVKMQIHSAEVEIVNEMFSMLPSELRFPNGEQIHQICTVLVGAFYESLQQADHNNFETIFMETVQSLELSNANIEYWQEMISVLRREMTRLPLPWLEGKTLSLAENMLHFARSILAESAQRRDHRHQYQRSLHERTLNSLTALLSAALSEVQVVEILNTHLADMGIRHARLLFFEAENEDPVAWSLQAGMESGMQNQRFPSREFPPDGLYADDELLNLILLPLVFQDEVLGYAAFEASDLAACAVIARQLAATIMVSRLHTQVIKLSLTDALTGLHNRRYLDIFFEKEFARSRRFARQLAVIVADLDHFKQYNDMFGHAEGDEALRQLAQCLVHGRRSSDVVVRTGGEEFVIVLQETDREGTMKVAEQLRSSVAAISNLKQPITISLGVAMLEQHIHKPEVLLECADQALYEAKKGGRNRICLYTEKMKS